MVTAITRAIPDSFVDAIRRDPRPINLAKARRQHQAYVQVLSQLVDEVVELDADERYPDCVFVEDAAVVAEGHALLARSGHPARRGETGPVRRAVEGMGLTLHDVPEPATLDGGDVLRVGDTLYVGRSGRTNGEGVAAVARVFGPLGLSVVPVAVEGLHLKSTCSSPIDTVVLVAPHTVSPERFDAKHVIVVPEDEAHGANAVGHDATVVIAGGCPTLRRALEELGLQVLEVGTSEVRKADGALTCCSIIVR